MKYQVFRHSKKPCKREFIMFRHKVSMEVRKYLSDDGFVDVETPYLIKSTPEGARDFLVPSRMNARTVLCFTAISANLQAIVNDWWVR